VRELRVRSTTAASGCNRRECPKDHPLNQRRWCAQHQHIYELLRGQCKLQGAGHALAVYVTEASEAKGSLNHMHEPLAGGDFNPYSNIAVGSVPLAMPHPWLDDSSLTRTHNASLPVPLDCEFTLEWREAFDD
jgi:hypothetical protein